MHFKQEEKMPVNLTESVTTGDLDGSDYDEAKIVKFEMDLKAPYLRCIIEHGNTVEGEWVKGDRKEDIVMLIVNVDEENMDYDDYVTANQTLYNNVKTTLYNKAIDLGLLAGTIS